MQDYQDFIAHANIERFKILLKTETDPGKAIVLSDLLMLERAKLANLRPEP